MVIPKSPGQQTEDKTGRTLSYLLRDTDSLVVSTLQGFLVIAVGVYLALKGYFKNDCSWPIDRETDKSV